MFTGKYASLRSSWFGHHFVCDEYGMQFFLGLPVDNLKPLNRALEVIGAKAKS
jgi:hypothetical protein